MRLIDADKIKQSVTNEMLKAELNSPVYCTLECVIADIESQPTAYDVDKVVEQMEKDTELAYNRYMDCSPNAPQSVVARYSTQYQERARCLEIIKSGGID